MKKINKKKKYIIISGIILTIIIASIIATIIINKSKNAETSSSTSLVETQVSTQTIQKTLTGSGQITTSDTEKLALTTTKYFSTMCVEEDDTVKAGENILKYTDGTYLTATYDCVISSYSVPETGKICTSSNYVQVKNVGTLNMTLSVNESEINSISVGQSVSITVNAIENKTYTGTITKIDSVGTYSSSGSTFTATIEFANDGNIKIGMSASCTIILEEADNCIAVPIAAIQTSGSNKYVIVVKNDGTTENVNVETGISNDNYVQIKSGLSGNETIQMLKTTSTTSTTSSKKSSSSSSSSSSKSSSSSSFGGSMSEMGGEFPGGMSN